MQITDFRYELPEESIAQTPIEPRDAARLLDARDMADRVFRDLADMLDPGDLVVVNTTRVRRARLRGRKRATGGKVEMLLLDRKEDGTWRALVAPARRVRPGSVFEFGDIDGTVVDGPEGGVVAVVFSDDAPLERIGTIPLPPYIREELEDPERYQTVYADLLGSAAAPTAGLHFTPAVLDRLDERGVRRATVDLRVGLGTFQPISVDRVEDHRMHREWCSIPEVTAAAVADARRIGGKVVAVGTTTVRTLETFAREDGTVSAGATETDLFLTPGSTFHVVDGLVTNFHIPGSSLLVMLAGFMGDRWRATYSTALDRGYRFLSFGDAMYCERQR